MVLLLELLNRALEDHDIPHLCAIVQNVGLFDEGLGVEEIESVLGRGIVVEDRIVGAMLGAQLESTRDVIAEVDLGDFVAKPSLAGFAGVP